jgi:cell division protein YceG involved in septum cleavage
MKTKPPQKMTPIPITLSKRRFHFYSGAAIVLFIILIAGLLSTSFHYAYVSAFPVEILSSNETEDVLPFPVGVDPKNEKIVENVLAETYFAEEIAEEPSDGTGPLSLIRPLIGKLALLSWYQNLASASTRILIIEPGERKEQIAYHFGKILGWSEDEKREFLATVISLDPIAFEGKFAPGTYVVAREAKPYDVALQVSERFNETILERYPADIERVVPLKDTLIVASLLEREAYDFTDMRYISGVIWNRLFFVMSRKIDATLQYAKGEKSSKTWWPRVTPEDKYINSAFNTYRITGLPPSPIANPSANAILAALNPRQTDCMYYFHDRKANFHCSKTYEEHVSLLKQYYGRGK